MLCHLSLKVKLYKNNMHILLLLFLRIKIHHLHDHIQKTLQCCQFANLAEFVFVFLFMKS